MNNKIKDNYTLHQYNTSIDPNHRSRSLDDQMLGKPVHAMRGTELVELFSCAEN